MVAILDEYSTSFLRDLGGLISGVFNLVEFLLGISFFCGQKLTEWTITAGTTLLEFFAQVVDVFKAIGIELWDFGGSVVRGLLLIYYGIWMIFEAIYYTAVDFKSLSVHVFTSVGQVLNETQAAVTYHTSSAYTDIPKHICDSLSFVGNTVIGFTSVSLQILQDFLIQLVLAPVNVIQAIGNLLYKLALVPISAYPYVPMSAHVGLAVVLVLCTVYWKLSILSLFRKLPRAMWYIYYSMRNIFVVVSNFKRITEETIRSGGSRTSPVRRDTTARCVVCQEATVSIISIPCKHVCLCYACVKILVDFDSRCPLCRGVVTQFEKVYIPL